MSADSWLAPDKDTVPTAMKTSELTGPGLDYWVAKARGWYLQANIAWYTGAKWNQGNCTKSLISKDDYQPSIKWSQCGPLIETHKISLQYDPINVDSELHVIDIPPWYALMVVNTSLFDARGETPLIAACRCLVSSKYGEEVPKS